MARRNQQTFAKRQREQKRAEKARQKLAKREARNDPDARPPGTEGVDSLGGSEETDGAAADAGG